MSEVTVSVEMVMVINGEHALHFTDSDRLEIDDVSYPKKLTGYEITKILAEHTQIYYKGKMFGFTDTEVRDQLYAVFLEKGLVE